MHSLLCSKCGYPRGKHSVFSYDCPTDSGFDPNSRFELQVSRLSMERDDVLNLQNKSFEVIEQEVARRVLKNVEAALGTFDMHRQTLSKCDVIDVLALLKKGYGL